MNNLTNLAILGFSNSTPILAPELDFGNGSGGVGLENDFDDSDDGDPSKEYIFDRFVVRAIFITLYTIVFCSCFFGNLIVILVVTLHWRMRSITNFCLANLAIANICVGVFCIYQNLSTLLIESWIFGDFMCKMYHFINSLSYTSSILILVVICIERYLAIIHPIRSRQILTITRLRLCIVLVWVISAVYCSPRLYYFKTITVQTDGEFETLCILSLAEFKDKLKIYDLLNFFLIFLIPMTILTVLYSTIAVTLWKTSKSVTEKDNPEAPSISLSSSNYSSCEDADQETQASNGDACGERESIRGAYLITLKRRDSESLSCVRRTSRLTRIFTVCFPRGKKESVSVRRSLAKDTRVATLSEEPKMDRDRKRLVQLRIGSEKEPDSVYGDHERGVGEKVATFAGQESCQKTPCLENDGGCPGVSDGVPFPRDCSRVNKSPITFTRSTVRKARFSYSKGKLHSISEMSDKKGGSVSESILRKQGSKRRKHSSVSSSGTRTHRKSEGASSRHSEESGGSVDRHKGSVSPPKLKRIGAMRICRIGNQALNSRRRVIRMLIVIVVTFALCNLPFHARKIWQIWSPSYSGGSVFSALFTPITFLILYANCAINPILYAFMSTAFRTSFKDLISGKRRASMGTTQRRTCDPEAH